MTRQIIGGQEAVRLLMSLCRNYKEAALRAIRQGSHEIYIPADVSNPEVMLEALTNPRGMIRSHGNSGKEPCYASLTDFLAGQNADGTEHKGYLVIDVVEDQVIGFRDRNGRSVVKDRAQSASGMEGIEEIINNNASYCGFIGNFPSVVAVRALDDAELKRIGGSYEAIAARMDELIRKSDNVMEEKGRKRDELLRKKDNAYRKKGYDPKKLWEILDSDIKAEINKVEKEIDEIYRMPSLLSGEREIELINLISTRGFQECPFTKCRDNVLSSIDCIIRNARTGRELWVNPMTSHLARAHHLLEKGNKYGISAEEFYKHFMNH